MVYIWCIFMKPYMRVEVLLLPCASEQHTPAAHPDPAHRHMMCPSRELNQPYPIWVVTAPSIPFRCGISGLWLAITFLLLPAQRHPSLVPSHDESGSGSIELIHQPEELGQLRMIPLSWAVHGPSFQGLAVSQDHFSKLLPLHCHCTTIFVA